MTGYNIGYQHIGKVLSVVIVHADGVSGHNGELLDVEPEHLVLYSYRDRTRVRLHRSHSALVVPNAIAKVPPL